MGSDSATVSDAARAWLQVQLHFDSLTRGVDFRRITDTATSDIQQIQALCRKRVKDGMTDAHYLALLLGARPSMRNFVSKQGLLGSASDQTLGNTDTMKAAQRCLKNMASALPVEGKSNAEVGTAFCKGLQIYLEVSDGQPCHTWTICLHI